MSTIMGFSVYGAEFFKPPTPPVRDIYNIELSNSIIDELHVRENTSNVDTSSNKDNWRMDTRLLAKFANDLEAGNISNSGLVIERFAIKRRKTNEIDALTVGYAPFINNETVKFTDYTQPNGEWVYSIVPIASNIEGKPNNVQVESEFVGWWIIDKDNGLQLGFDKFMDGDSPEVETQLNQGRTVIETLSKFPQIYYDEREYHSFTLNTVLIPSEFERSGHSFETVLNNFIKNHKPFIVKASDGRVFVCDISNPRFSNPMNNWKKYDYGTLTLDFVEISDYEEHMKE